MASCLASEGVETLDLVVSPSKSFQKVLPINTPNSVEGYRQRVESFTTFRWLTHLPLVSPLECAVRGWECVETDLLRCVSCRAFLYGRNDDLLTNTESDEKLKEALIRNHQSYCVWLTTSSPASFYALSFSSGKECRDRVVAALRDLAQLPRRAIPALKLDLSSSSSSSSPVDIDDVVVPAMESERRSLRLGVDAWRPLLTLALCGWTLASDKNANERLWNRLCIKIRCQSCRRCLGLWDYRAMFPAVEEPETGKTPIIAAAVVECGKKVTPQAKDAQEIRRKEKEEKIVAIVTEASCSNRNQCIDGSNFKIVHPKSPPPKTIAAQKVESTNDADDESTSPKLNRKSVKKSPEKTSDQLPPPSPQTPSTARPLSSSPPSSSSSSEIRTRQRSQSSPNNPNNSALEQDGITTRSGTIMRSPIGEPTAAALFKGVGGASPAAAAATEKKKRQRSGDSNHSGDGDKGERSAKKRAAASTSDAAAEDRTPRRKLQRGGALSTTKNVAVVEAKAGGREVEEDNFGSESEDDEAAAAAAIDQLLAAEAAKAEPMEFGTAALDPIAEHRLWCPFAAANYRFADDEDLPAWEYVKRWLEAGFDGGDETPARSSWMNDNLKKARKLMGF